MLRIARSCALILCSRISSSVRHGDTRDDRLDGTGPPADGLLYRESAPFLFGNRHLIDVVLGHQRAKKEYNLVLLHPDDGSVESWTEEGSGDKMRADFADFEPRYVTRPPVHVSSRWSPAEFLCACHQRPEAAFVCQVDVKVASDGPKTPADLGSPKGTPVLLSDACHPMLVRMLPCGPGGMCWLTLSLAQPYRAQGAAIAVEDAAVLGALLSHVSSLAHIGENLPS